MATELMMKTRWAGILLIIAALGASGCASMSADECAVSDWHTIGYEDGARGYSGDQIGKHRKACAKHGVAPDFESYQAGRKDGLRQYCQPSRGFNVGASGGRYNGVCPSDMEYDFVEAFNSGHQLYNLRASVNSATYQINARESELEQTKDDIRTAEAALIAKETTMQDRILLLADLKELSERIGQIEAETVDLIEERAIAEQQLASYQSVLADAGY
jgi:hypothetical protein